MDVKDAFDDEIAKLKMKIEESKNCQRVRLHELGKLKEENAGIILKQQQTQRALQEREKELHELETEEMQLEAKIGTTNMRLQERITVRRITNQSKKSHDLF